jgi:hypothetical protein
MITSDAPGDKWVLELQGVRILAVYAVDGFHLSLSDPDRQLGTIAKHPDAIQNLEQALIVGRALLEEYLRDSRRVTVDMRELFQTVWKRVQ